MGIREAINNLPAAGTFKTVPVANLGDVEVLRLSVDELLAIPDEKSTMHTIVKTCHDEQHVPLFTSIDDPKLKLPALHNALAEAVNSVNTLDLAAVAKD